MKKKKHMFELAGLPPSPLFSLQAMRLNPIAHIYIIGFTQVIQIHRPGSPQVG